MGTFNEADHPRDDIGRFTFKNGGGDSSGSNVVLEGKVEKTDSTSGGGSSIGEKAGEILNIIVSTVTNPQVVQAALNIALTVKSAQEQHKLLKRLYENYEHDKKMEDRANILYPSMEDKTEKEQKHKLKNEIAVDHIDNPILKKAASKFYGNETAENLLMSKKDTYLNTDYAKEHLIFKNYKELSPDLRDYFKEKITKQIGADKLDTTGGIYINAQHQSSKDLAKVLADNREFIKKAAENRKSLNFGKSFDTSIQFTDNHFYYAIGKADIKNMHINKNGDLDLLITDVYDFNNDKNASDLVKVGRDRQEKGEIIPYFYIYHVIIPKNLKLNDSKRK